MPPRQQVYGKRSRAIYNPLGGNLPSPEQPVSKPTKPPKTHAVKAVAPENFKLIENDEERTERPVLGERSHNADGAKSRKKSSRTRTKRKVNDAEKNLASNTIQDQENVIERDRLEAQATDEAVLSEIQTSKETKSRRKRGEATSRHKLERALGEKGYGFGMGEEKSKEESIPLAQVQLSAAKGTHIRFDQDDCPTTPRPIPRECPFEQQCASLLDLCLHPLTCFHSWSEQLSEHFDVTKIAEASFGEVYRLSLSKHMPDFSSTDESVFKIIPLQAPESTLPRDKRKLNAEMKRQEMMSKPDDVANEVRLLQRMSAIPGFTNFRDVRILQGRPPPAFARAFKAWNVEQRARKKETSHFPDPSKKTSYSDNQLWAVIEMQDAGTDLERLVENGACKTIWTVWDICWQVVLSLAKGEESAEFEHRDLHLGNICVRSSTAATAAAADDDIQVDKTRKLNFTSLETTIIDYTISRCAMQDDARNVAYHDLSRDDALFEGDSTEEYQYDIYRYMRSVLFLDEALADFAQRPADVKASGRDWEQFHPQTNLVWLHLVLYKLLEQIEWPSASKAPAKSKKTEHAKWKKANALEKILLRVQDLLYPGEICANGIRSAGNLVVLALSEGWLDVEDVVGHGAGDESALVSQLEGLQL